MELTSGSFGPNREYVVLDPGDGGLRCYYRLTAEVYAWMERKMKAAASRMQPESESYLALRDRARELKRWKPAEPPGGVPWKPLDAADVEAAVFAPWTTAEVVMERAERSRKCWTAEVAGGATVGAAVSRFLDLLPELPTHRFSLTGAIEVLRPELMYAGMIREISLGPYLLPSLTVARLTGLIEMVLKLHDAEKAKQTSENQTNNAVPTETHP